MRFILTNYLCLLSLQKDGAQQDQDERQPRAQDQDERRRQLLEQERQQQQAEEEERKRRSEIERERKMNEELAAKQQELFKLQQHKLELELEETRRNLRLRELEVRVNEC